MTVKKKTNKINLIGAMNQSLLDYSWSVNFNHVFKYKPKPFQIPRVKQIYGFLGTALRLVLFIFRIYLNYNNFNHT